MASCYGPSPCGVFQGSSPDACPNCRDLPESDIDSPRTSWRCVCGGACLSDHEKLCIRRQILRTIIRLISLQYEIALTFRAETMDAVVYAYRDMPPSPNILPRRIIYWKFRSRTALDAFEGNFPEEVKVQACCVENCVNAIRTTSPSLAWLAEDMPLKIRELDVVPAPIKHIHMQHETERFPHPSAKVHTVLVLAPDITNKQDANWKVGPEFGSIWDQDARVGDATFPQYDYDRNCHATLDYLCNKLKEDKDSEMFPFGDSYKRHEDDLGETGNVELVQVREAGIRCANHTVHREINKLGGRQEFLVRSSHEDFVNGRQVLIKAVQLSLRELRAEADSIRFLPDPEPSEEQKRMGLQRLIEDCASIENTEVMAAFDRVRRSNSL